MVISQGLLLWILGLALDKFPTFWGFAAWGGKTAGSWKLVAETGDGGVRQLAEKGSGAELNLYLFPKRHTEMSSHGTFGLSTGWGTLTVGREESYLLAVG